MQKRALLEKIRQSNRLPMLPDIAMRVLALREDPDLYPAKVQAVIASDPVLSARLLQVANSAMYRTVRQVAELGEAITLLGVDLTMSIATGIAVVDAMRTDEVESSEFPYDLFWRKSVLSAIAANEMVADLTVDSRGELFVAALLQDLGMLALSVLAGERYGKLVKLARSHFDLVELEERALGVNHAEVTAVMLQQWGLPDSICEAVGHSHALFAEGSTYNLSDLQYGVALSSVLAELWIADAPEQNVLDDAVRAYMDRVGEDAYRNTVESIIEAVPGANQIFNIQLLSDSQMAAVA